MRCSVTGVSFSATGTIKLTLVRLLSGCGHVNAPGTGVEPRRSGGNSCPELSERPAARLDDLKPPSGSDARERVEHLTVRRARVSHTGCHQLEAAQVSSLSLDGSCHFSELAGCQRLLEVPDSVYREEPVESGGTLGGPGR